MSNGDPASSPSPLLSSTSGASVLLGACCAAAGCTKRCAAAATDATVRTDDGEKEYDLDLVAPLPSPLVLVQEAVDDDSDGVVAIPPGDEENDVSGVIVPAPSSVVGVDTEEERLRWCCKEGV